MRPERVGDSYRTTRRLLAEFLPEAEADREARLILAHALGWSAAGVMTRMDEPWPPGDAPGRFLATLEARIARQPLAQILGEWSFFGRAFHVTRDTLTPRPDTETLVELALAAPFGRLLDLGTGTGAIAVTLLAERPAARGVATDISQSALDVAARNAARHGVADRLSLHRADWFTGLEGAAFDLIVSNPPYVAADVHATLAPEVTKWEPYAALSPGPDGLAAYRVIVAGAPERLAPQGRLLVEIGFDQGGEVAGLMAQAGLDAVDVHPDINGTPRVVIGRKPG